MKDSERERAWDKMLGLTIEEKSPVNIDDRNHDNKNALVDLAKNYDNVRNEGRASVVAGNATNALDYDDESTSSYLNNNNSNTVTVNAAQPAGDVSNSIQQ